MQAVIMAAGKGKRLGQLTKQMPKCLLDVGGMSIIERQIGILRKYDINDIIVVVGYQAAMVKERLERHRITFVFNPFYETTNVLTSFWFAREKIRDDFIFLHGDTIFDQPIFGDMFVSDGDVVLPVQFKDCGEEEMKVITEGPSVVKISKELSLHESDGEFIGVAKIGEKAVKDVIGIVDDFMVKGEFNLYFESAIQGLIDKKKYLVTFSDTKDHYWNEIDFVDDLEKARKIFKK